MSLSALGNLYTTRKDYSGAEKTLKQVHLGCIKVLGPDDPASLLVVYRLAIAIRMQGNFQKSILAVSMLQESLSFSRRKYGERYTMTKNLKAELALVFVALSRLDEAEKTLNELVNANLEEHGRESPYTQRTLGLLYECRQRLRS